jgi:hypothetical protein
MKKQENRICKCGKPASSNKKNGRTYWKNICSACASAKYRRKNPDKIKAIRKKCKTKYKSQKEFFKEQLMLHINQLCCKNCGNQDKRVLNFHHRNPEDKSFRIAWAFTHSYSLENMKKEVEKCDVLCCNCHFIAHATKPEGKNWKIKRSLLEHLCQDYCTICQNNDIRSLSFHHRDPNEKEFGIACNQLAKPIGDLKKEVEKCTILCENCHRILHAELKEPKKRCRVRRGRSS